MAVSFGDLSDVRSHHALEDDGTEGVVPRQLFLSADGCLLR